MGDSVAEAVQRPGVATPGKDQFACAACTDELVVDDVGGHPYERQVTQLLADDLVSGHDGDEMGESFQSDRVAVLDELTDHLVQGHDHAHPRSYSEFTFAKRTLCVTVALSRTGSRKLSAPHVRSA